ncbi:cobalt-precorrin 5A hydrolase [Pseudomonas duriflava]|uniref:Cobalt-precorrin 5A hydrolase n=1 Tax=Pseudomonas duriflava TaxID=459528 RepID=A0A562Q2W6_9PSED|nr:cobalamin biosynthesis protein [Pseudomonas duriflava]TWI50988.1 cobalt-precorrin 5A hydrolase [Pseudomonas duriflava]
MLTIVSLTDTGAALAQRLIALSENAEWLHRPQSFTSTVQQRFQAGHRLALICATGIAVRTLAPVLKDKYNDPPVLVLDEAGSFIIPLLSGHEGGANAWAQDWAERLEAHCVITSARRYTRPLYVAGLGCERGCPEGVLHALMEETLAAHSLTVTDVSGLASIALKSDEVGMLALARTLGVPIQFFEPDALNRYENQLTQRSAIVFRETSCYGVAEAAALALAEQMTGGPAELVVPKHKNARATFALARAYQDHT